jgi:hypothetical protein
VSQPNQKPIFNRPAPYSSSGFMWWGAASYIYILVYKFSTSSLLAPYLTKRRNQVEWSPFLLSVWSVNLKNDPLSFNVYYCLLAGSSIIRCSQLSKYCSNLTAGFHAKLSNQTPLLVYYRAREGHILNLWNVACMYTVHYLGKNPCYNVVNTQAQELW